MAILDGMAYLHIRNLIKKRPLDINIETINICPLRCVFCCNRIYKREYTIMDNKLFENIVRQYFEWGGGSLSISSMQSDFFSDPMLVERMKIIKKYKKKLWVYGTTPLISCKKYNDKELLYILRLFDLLQISVEGYDKETYKTMAGINGFEILLEQLKRIEKIIEDNGLKVKIDICFRTCNKEKVLRSELYKELSHKFNIYDVKDTFFSWFGSIKKEDLPKGAKLLLKYNSEKRENCSNANVSMTVMPDGKVLGCGCIDWLGKYVIGDCKKSTLEEIWKSSKAIKFRNAFKNGKLPSICEECGLYTSFDAAMKDKRLINYKPTDGLVYLVRQEKRQGKKIWKN